MDTKTAVPDTGGAEREELLSGLLAAVQSCQIRYGGRTELATESDSRVAGLCKCLEDALSHGLKPRTSSKGLAAIRQVKDIVSSGLSLHLSLNSQQGTQPVLWWYVRELLTRHEYERFLLLKNVLTDEGRGKAWIRSLLNEHSLERYMHILVCDEKLLVQWYEPWALLRDQERAAMLPTLAAGLDSILFAINIDNHNLNGDGDGRTRSEPILCTQNEPEPQIVSNQSGPPVGEDSNSSKKKEHRRKKKKVPSQLVSFDEEDLGSIEQPAVHSPLYHSAPTTCLNSPAPTLPPSSTPYADRLDKLAQQEGPKLHHNFSTESLDLNKDTISNQTSNMNDESYREGNPSVEPSYFEVLDQLISQQQPTKAQLQEESQETEGSGDAEVKAATLSGLVNLVNTTEQDTASYKSSISNLSGESYSSETENGVGATILTPVLEDGVVGNLIPVSPQAIPAALETTQSDDDLSEQSYSQEVEDAAAAVAAVAQDSQSVTNHSMSTSSSFSTLNIGELRAAVLEISAARDAAEGRRMEVASALTKEMENSSVLRAQMAHEQTKHTEAIEKLNARISTLSRENDLLKHQLKKYVGAVQLLRREGGEVALHNPQPPTPPPQYRDYHYEATQYESKLIQVAEMHGELMEFNEQLQHQVRIREAQVRRLREELEELRGPLPIDHDEDEDVMSMTSDLDAHNISGAHRTLINIWIPSAFLTGSSADTHHVYQIYIRIKDEEWNVYRRYTQLHHFHKSLKRKDPVVKTFNFPQKKTFGYKDITVVEERRVCLQQYLRLLMNHILATNPQLANNPQKSTLASLLPFLVDSSEAPDNNPKPKSRKLLARLSGNSNRQENRDSSDALQYNGL
ncbi:sorting nexin-29-like isoform X2 [Oratosquilla oratoria]|uniref:sorting nexin-29-like isoform X2 n=1 Tax=Oratosquilla oratoria TaxID=337810 RepID=UPI003F7675F4